MNLLLTILKYDLKINYFFIKLITKKENNVFFLSRQSNELPLNYSLIIDELKSRNLDAGVNIVCNRIESNIDNLFKKQSHFYKIKKGIKYYFNLHKQMYYISKSKVVIVDGYNIPVSILKHKKNTYIIQMWHSLAAIKKFGYQTLDTPGGTKSSVARILNMHRNYDLVLSGSKYMNQFFAKAFNVHEDIVKEIGTPQIDYLLMDNKDIGDYIKQNYINNKKPNVLYAPTFKIDDNNKDYENFIKEFPYNKFNLIIKKHPKSKMNVTDNRVLEIIDNDINVLDLVKVADYVITDYSALSADVSVVDKKIILYVYDYDEYVKTTGLNIDLFKEFPKYTFKNYKEVIKVLKEDKYDAKEIEKFKNKFVTNQRGNSTKLIVDIIEKNLGD